MPRVRYDPALALPEPPRLDAALPPFAGPLRLAGDPAADDPFTLAGRRALAAGGEGRGVDDIWVHPLRVLEELRLEGAAAREAAVMPVGIERRLDLGGRGVIERIFVPRDLAGAVLEWHAPEGAELTLSWRTDLRLLWPSPAGAPGPLHWRREGRVLLIRAGDGGKAAAFATSEAPQTWEAADASTGAAPAVAVRLTARMAPGESFRLAVVASTEGDEGLAAALDALRPDSLVRARAAALQRLRTGRLAIRAPDPAAEAALEWAKYRLDSYLVETPGVGRSLVAGYRTSEEWDDGRPGYARYFSRDAVWTALASLACGDFEAARDVVRFLGEHQDRSGKIPHECTITGTVHDDPDATPLYLLLVARYLAWTGDLHSVREQWERVRRACAYCLGADTGDDAAIRTTALRELAVAAESLGERALAGELKERAERAKQALEAPFMAPLQSGRASPAEFAAGRSEAAFRHWWISVERGFQHAKGARDEALHGTECRSAGARPDQACSAAMVVSPLVYGLLGAEPDATRHRLRLRPQIPAAWDRLEVLRLRMGDAEVALRYRREGDRHTFRLDQESGSVPLRVVFEPALPARRLVAARVDGQEAALDPRPFGERMLVPLQVVLDHERAIELEASHDAARPPSRTPSLRVWQPSR